MVLVVVRREAGRGRNLLGGKSCMQDFVSSRSNRSLAGIFQNFRQKWVQ